MSAYQKKTWRDFLDSGLLWWVNRSLHLFGWVIVLEEDDGGVITSVYPARTRVRGFNEETDDHGFKTLTDYLSGNIEDIQKDLD